METRLFCSPIPNICTTDKDSWVPNEGEQILVVWFLPKKVSLSWQAINNMINNKCNISKWRKADKHTGWLEFFTGYFQSNQGWGW